MVSLMSVFLLLEPNKILWSGHGHQPWHLSNFGADADEGFSLGPTSILGVEPSEPVCVQVGSRRSSHMSDP